MAKEIRQTLFWRTARPFQTIRGCLLCCEEVLGAVWMLFLLVAHFHLSNRRVCHKHGGVVQIQSRSLVPCYCPLFRRNVMKTDTWHVDVGSGKSVWKMHKEPCWAVMFALERVVFIPFLSLSCLSFLCQSDRPRQAKRIQNARSSLSFSLSACGQASTRPRSAFGFVPYFSFRLFLFSSDLPSKSFSSSSNSSYISLRGSS